MKGGSKRLTRGLVALGITAAGWAALTGGQTAGAAPAEISTESLVEDHRYPDADRIQQERGIRLIRGDGHILFVDCGGAATLINVWSRAAADPFCFRVTGPRGHLVLELDRVYLIKGGTREATAAVTVDGRTETVEVPPNTWVGVGEGQDPDSGPATLVELRVQP